MVQNEEVERGKIDRKGVQNWEVQLCRIGRRIGTATVQICGEHRCNIGRRIGRLNDAELGTQRLRCGRRIGRCNGADVGGELGGGTVQNGRFNGAELGGASELAGELGVSTMRNWEVQLCHRVSRVLRSNGSELGGGTMQNCRANWGVKLAGELRG
jgi:hypothetical protein